MDQLKEILKQAIKYRFWILVGLSALLPLIAYFASAGSLNAQTKAETDKIEGAAKTVKEYESGVKPNSQYKGLVDQRKDVLTKDVNAAWKILYDRQAPLLTWPPDVADLMTTWGRKWPAGVDEVLVDQTIRNYIRTYKDYVAEVYKTFRPFSYDDGTGVVAAPAEDALLRPARFSEISPPSLGKVWAAQERLWVQRTVLDVVDKVNKNAKDWDTAVIKQINALEVADPVALDQRSAVKGDTLEPAPDITNPAAGTAPVAQAAAAPAEGSPGRKGPLGSEGSAGGSGGMAAASAAASDELYVVKAKSPQQQYQVVPIFLDVLMEQMRIPELIVACQNSPMTVQVLDFEMQRPGTRVKKPVKGELAPVGYGGGMGMMGGRGMGMMGEMVLGGGNPMMGGPGRSGGYGGEYGGNMNMQMQQQMSRMGGGRTGYGSRTSSPVVEIRKGVDVREEQLKKEAEKKKAKEKGKSEEEEPKQDSAESKISDPYFNIIEVKIWGQARFYQTPPADAAPAQTTGEAAPAPAGDAKTETPAAKKDEAAKPDSSKAETSKDAEPETKKDEASKPDEPAPDNDQAAPNEKDAEAKAADAPKADAPKAEAPKPDQKKDTAAPKSR
jgi:hypothetical protein